MNIKLFLPLMGIVLLTACNNNSSKNDAKDDTARAENSKDDHGHTKPGGTVPELPAVPEGARVFFDNLKEGEEVSSPFKVKMGNDKIKIDTAGPVVSGSGHHHLLIDRDGLPSGEVIPNDAVNIHFGKGQTETELTLSPGKHKLTLQFADGLHRSYGSQLSASITINVKK